MTAPDALFNALRIPGQIVVHHQIAELQVDALGCGLRGNHDAGLIAEILDDGCALVCGR